MKTLVGIGAFWLIAISAVCMLLYLQPCRESVIGTAGGECPSGTTLDLGPPIVCRCPKGSP